MPLKPFGTTWSSLDIPLISMETASLLCGAPELFSRGGKEAIFRTDLLVKWPNSDTGWHWCGCRGGPDTVHLPLSKPIEQTPLFPVLLAHLKRGDQVMIVL